MKTLKKLFRKIMYPFYTVCDTFTYYPYYYIDANGKPSFIKTRRIKVLKSFKIKAHDQATADNDAYEYINDNYPDKKQYILFR
mgnify:CR=1 FL=1